MIRIYNCHFIKTVMPAFILMVLFASGCAGIREAEKNMILEGARAAYSRTQDEGIAANAPVAAYEATEAMSKAEQARNADEMKHLAYLAEKQSMLAVAVAEQKMAEKEVEALGKEKEQMVIKAREREIEVARIEANTQALEAERIRKELEAKAKEIEKAKSEAEAMKLRAEKAKKEAEAQTQEAERARLQAEEAIAKSQELEKELAELKGTRTPRGMVLTLGDILFATGKDVLLPGGMDTLDKLVSFLQKYPNRKVLVEGHTDSVGSETYNMGLSQRRANAVQGALLAKGIDKDRITATGYGESRPAASNADPSGRQQNRRVEIVILDEGVSGEGTSQ